MPPPPEKPQHYLIVDYPLTLTPRQRLYKFGRFIGRKGEHIRPLETKFNVRINILNEKSSKPFRQSMNKSSVKDATKNRNNLCLLITMNDKNGDIHQIKQTLENTWKQIDVTTRKTSSRIRSAASLVTEVTDLSLDGDTRWTPVRKSKNKRKEKLNQIKPPEVPPQPSIPPISMPKELPKHQKGKRK